MTACNPAVAPGQPPWPSKEAIRAFDLGPVQSDRAIVVLSSVVFGAGVSAACGDDWVVPKATAAGNERLGDFGKAAYAVLRAEVERLHPGARDNGWAADMLLANLMQNEIERGRVAASIHGCDSLRPAEAEMWRAWQ